MNTKQNSKKTTTGIVPITLVLVFLKVIGVSNLSWAWVFSRSGSPSGSSC